MGIIDLSGVRLWFQHNADDLTSSSSGGLIGDQHIFSPLYLNNQAPIQAGDNNKSM